MTPENKLNVTDSAQLARTEEELSKAAAVRCVTRRSNICSKMPFTADTHDRKLFMKGIDHSYAYEGYSAFAAKDLAVKS